MAATNPASPSLSSSATTNLKNNSNNSDSQPHAVSRSNELLSCARTALKIAKSKADEDNPLRDVPLSSLQLNPVLAPAATTGTLEDGLTLLRAMDNQLKKLHGLVRRRGHTNDPSEEIAVSVKQLEMDLKELTELVEGIQKLPHASISKQSSKHWSLVAAWFQQVASHHSNELKQILKVRGTVLADQAQRRKRVAQADSKKQNSLNGRPSRQPGARSAALAKSTPLFDSPLFTATQEVEATGNGYSNNNNSNDSANNATAAASTTPYNKNNDNNNSNIYPQYTTNGQNTNHYGNNNNNNISGAANGSYAGYGAPAANNNYGQAGGVAGYGGGYYDNHSSNNYGNAGYGGSSNNFGMRNRKAQSTRPDYSQTQQQQESFAVQQQIQERQQKRQTANRLAEARQAERTLGDLGTLFSKMSTLVSQQGEVLEKVEDDVEAAFADVSAGQEELTKLYSIKKGNRALIIKTFAILIFLICFLRLYKN